jgi:hypothetical protein
VKAEENGKLFYSSVHASKHSRQEKKLIAFRTDYLLVAGMSQSKGKSYFLP